MTECERIIKEGIVPESFLEEEVRCDFFVDKNRKKLWTLLLDLLLEFDIFCKENNLTYFICSGTMLGAARHKGFIPWDDDIDVAMPREDYQKLLKLHDKFKYPYHLLTPYTDKGYYRTFFRVCNVNTTFATEVFIDNDFTQGCFIDIFPFDRFDIEDSDELYDKVKFYARSLGVVMKKANPKFENEDMEIEELLHKMSPLAIYEKVQELAMKAGTSKSKYMTSLVSSITHFRKKAYPIECFNSISELEFENYKFPVPSGYKEMLSCLYGDFMAFPPVEKRGTWHTGQIINPDVPYELFKKQYYQIK